MRRLLATTVLRLLGWKMGGTRPAEDRYVLIAAPHTSNWDFALMLLFAFAFDIKVTWMAKHSLFYPPMGWIMKALGGMPIVRHRNQKVVDSMVDMFARLRNLVLVVPTEGTRGRAEHWKSGFYHIALQSRVPIVPSFLDFGSKTGGFGPLMQPTGNVALDMDYFRQFYAGMRGKFPENFGPIRLQEEITRESGKR